MWARFEAQLEAHRRLETEALEPDIAQKLTEREAKEWRTRVRAEKRQHLAVDVYDIANVLAYVDGLPAQLKAIELADRPGCRDIRDRLEERLFVSLEAPPVTDDAVPDAPEKWRAWKLGAEWDAILARLEARLPAAKSEWERWNLQRQLATGFYRRGDKKRFAEMVGAHPKRFPIIGRQMLCLQPTISTAGKPCCPP